MKGKIQFPQDPLEGVVEDDAEDVEDDGVDVDEVEDPSLQIPDSSPTAAKSNLTSLKTLALSDNPSTPVGVPVLPRIKSGFE